MKIITRQVSNIFVLLALASCSSSIYQSTWQANPIIADGNPTEWKLPLRYSNSKSGLQYTITNDKSNIFICIYATEQPIQMKILSSGMEIWLDPSGKNKEAVGILFPLPGKRGQMPKTENMLQDKISGQKPGKMNMSEMFQLQEPQIALSGFLPEYNGTYMVSKAKGVKAAIDWDQMNNMTYELIIPLQAFYSMDIATLNANPVIGFKIVVNAMSGLGSSSHGNPPGGAAQGPPGGGGGHQGMEGGGPGGGMGRPPFPDNQDANTLSSTTSIKFKVQLNGFVKK